MAITQVLAYGVGALLLGVMLTLAAIFALVRRTDNYECHEGCVGVVLCVSVFVVAVYFFIRAF